MDRIKGLTIEIDGNTTKLSKALEGVNKDIKQTQTQLKDVEKLLKVDPGNIELLRQKQQLLAKAVDETKEKLQKLKDAQAQMDASGVDKTSADYQALQREIIATEKSLKDLQTAATNSNATMQKIAQTAKEVGDGANKVAQATKGLSSAAAGGLVALGGMAVKAGQDADELNTLAKQTGLSTEALRIPSPSRSYPSRSERLLSLHGHKLPCLDELQHLSQGNRYQDGRRRRYNVVYLHRSCEVP